MLRLIALDYPVVIPVLVKFNMRMALGRGMGLTVCGATVYVSSLPPHESWCRCLYAFMVVE